MNIEDQWPGLIVQLYHLLNDHELSHFILCFMLKIGNSDDTTEFWALSKTLQYLQWLAWLCHGGPCVLDGSVEQFCCVYDSWFAVIYLWNLKYIIAFPPGFKVAAEGSGVILMFLPLYFWISQCLLAWMSTLFSRFEKASCCNFI